MFPLENIPHLDHIQRLSEILGELRLVGGCVRDALLNRPFSDVDLVTPVEPEKGMDLLKAAGINVKPTGIQHGTIMAILDKVPYEITTLRHDISTDGRHAKVRFTDQWEEDALRRDFTMNSLYVDLSGKLYDYTGGLDDIKEGVVRFIGDAATRIQEDYLRILRLFRFQAHYGKKALSVETLTLCQQFAPCLTRLSRERIRQELIRLFEAESPQDIVLQMEKYGVLEAINLGSADLDTFYNLVKMEDEPSSWRRLAALFPKLSENPSAICATKSEKSFLNLLSNLPSTTEHSLILLLKDNPLSVVTDITLLLTSQGKLSSDSCTTILSHLNDMAPKKFPLKGKDLLSCGLPAGPDMGNLLTQCETWWYENKGRPTKEECLNWILLTINK